MRARTRIGIPAVAAIVGLALAGCGGDDDDDATTQAQTTETTQTETAGNALTITMDDYSFAPMDATANAGTVTISAPNEGQVTHELVVLKTDQSPTSLQLKGDEVDEEALEAKGVESPGEIEDVAAGAEKSGTFKLTPGKYLMICNLPGHFDRGMYGTITVK